LNILNLSAVFESPSPVPRPVDSAATSRREILTKTLTAGAAAVVATAGPVAANAYTVPDLPYPFEALEPYIDAPTMKIHHDKHHATYVANINKATEGKEEVPILDLMADALEAGPAYRNNGGGHYNHAFFWDEMAPADKAKDTKPSAELQALIDSSFGSMDEMKAKFEAMAAPGATFGSGWVWVVVNQAGDKLDVVNTANQDNPLMKGVKDQISFPILGLDVWEHVSLWDTFQFLQPSGGEKSFSHISDHGLTCLYYSPSYRHTT